jgi:hypothetical protein
VACSRAAVSRTSRSRTWTSPSHLRPRTSSRSSFARSRRRSRRSSLRTRRTSRTRAGRRSPPRWRSTPGRTAVSS